MNRGYLSHCRFKNPKTFCVSNCNSIKKSSWNAHLGMPLFLNMPPKAASPKKEVLQKKDFENFSTIVTSISGTSHKNNDYWFNNYYSNYDRGYCVYSLIKASQPSIVAKHRCQALLPSIVAKVVRKTTRIIHIQKWVTYRFPSYLVFVQQSLFPK